MALRLAREARQAAAKGERGLGRCEQLGVRAERAACACMCVVEIQRDRVAQPIRSVHDRMCLRGLHGRDLRPTSGTGHLRRHADIPTEASELRSAHAEAPHHTARISPSRHAQHASLTHAFDAEAPDAHRAHGLSSAVSARPQIGGQKRLACECRQGNAAVPRVWPAASALLVLIGAVEEGIDVLRAARPDLARQHLLLQLLLV